MEALFSKDRKTSIILISILVISVFGLFSGCKSNNSDTVAFQPDSIYIKAGDRIIGLTFDSLRNSLLRAISSQGIDDAITFCNENAVNLTNTYADSVSVRRTALRYRSVNNKPDSLELVVLQTMASEIESTKIPASKIIRNDISGEIHYFKPIITQAMCLNCHGSTETQIQPPVLSKIKDHYPGDQAINFKEGDLRGAWHILFRLK